MLHISLSPNVERDDVVAALSQLVGLRFFAKEGPKTTALQRALTGLFEGRDVHLTNSGRSALFTILRALGIGTGDEVIMQAFTCNAVANPILWAGATPIYVDIDGSYNMDPEAVRQAITPSTKAIIVQHTFGIPARIEELRAVADEHDVVLIEDCAHSFGATEEGQAVGTFADIAFLSFGRDKVISSVYGGAIVARGRYAARIRAEYERLGYPSAFWIMQQLLHPPLTSLARVTFPFGAVLLMALQRLRILSRAVSRGEYVGTRPTYFPARMPDALAALALLQLGKLQRFNEHRRMIAGVYEEALAASQQIELPEYERGAIFLRYPILSKEPRAPRAAARAKGYILGDWYSHVIDPAKTDCTLMGYTPGSAPRAERASSMVLNLPTHIHTSAEDARAIAAIILQTHGN